MGWGDSGEGEGRGKYFAEELLLVWRWKLAVSRAFFRNDNNSSYGVGVKQCPRRRFSEGLLLWNIEGSPIRENVRCFNLRLGGLARSWADSPMDSLHHGYKFRRSEGLAVDVSELLL